MLSALMLLIFSTEQCNKGKNANSKTSSIHRVGMNKNDIPNHPKNFQDLRLLPKSHRSIPMETIEHSFNIS
jgi:hypothetical protein